MNFGRDVARAWRELSEWCWRLSFLLLLVRVFAPPPDSSDPPDMHAFYHRWMQPTWLVIVAPLAFALLAPIVYASARIAWAASFQVCRCDLPIEDASNKCAACKRWLREP